MQFWLILKRSAHFSTGKLGGATQTPDLLFQVPSLESSRNFSTRQPLLLCGQSLSPSSVGSDARASADGKPPGPHK